jgi:restriction system protein
MGSITFQAETMFGSLSDNVGVKSGLALTDIEIREMLGRAEHNAFEEYIEAEGEDWLRVESVVYESMFEYLLFSVGRLKKPNNPPPIAALYHKYKKRPKELEVMYKISDAFTAFLNRAMEDPTLGRRKGIDPSPFMQKAADEYGLLGLDIASSLIENFAIQLTLKGAHFPSVSEWSDVIELTELFNSEGLNAQYGTFFDQRYIDYLHKNFEDIDRINWRKFEGLTAEYFVRAGFEVDVGPGRNDDGVDVRAWSTGKRDDEPPALIIQCKRQKSAVSKVIVKSLYADVQHEKAASGLIVTTSRLAPGAKKVCKVRNYPIEAADRKSLREWVEKMHKPGLGSAD